MKAILKICALIIICLFMSATFSYGNTTVKNLVNTHNLKIGSDVRYFNYEEDAANMEISGYLYGVSGEYAYHGISNEANNLMANIDFELLGGSLDYDGETWGGEPVSANTDDVIIQLRGLAGYDIVAFKHNLITHFVGVGYRYWYDDIGGVGGYEREIQYVYSPIGIKTLHSLSGKWMMGISAEYDFFWSGYVKSYLSNVDARYNDPEVEQGFMDGYGLRLSAHIKKGFTKIFSMSVEPYIRYWDIEKSDKAYLTSQGSPVAVVYEPANETTSYGLRLSFRF